MMMKTQALMMILNTESSQSQSTDLLQMQKSAGRKCSNTSRLGVVKDKYFANYQTHRAFTCLITNGCDFGGYEDETFESCFKNLLFADGTPFGVKVEE